MSKYIVYRCIKCGKSGIHELRFPKLTQNTRLLCKSCNKRFIFQKAKIYKICDNPYEAKDIMLGRNISRMPVMTHEQKIELYKAGRDFNQVEGQKINRFKAKKKTNKLEFVLESCKKIQEELGHIAESALMDQTSDYFPSQDSFNSYMRQLRRQGYLLQIKLPNGKGYSDKLA